MTSTLLAISSDWIPALSSAVVTLTALVALFLNKRQFVVVSMNDDKTHKSKKGEKTKKATKKHRLWLSVLNQYVIIDGQGLRGWSASLLCTVQYVDIRSKEQKERIVENLRTWLGMKESKSIILY